MFDELIEQCNIIFPTQCKFPLQFGKLVSGTPLNWNIVLQIEQPR